MSQLSIARSLTLALVGLTLVLAAVAGLAVGALYDARQDFEDALARTYAAEAATANVLAAAVIEEAVLRSQTSSGADRRQARAAFAAAIGGARGAAAGDPPSLELIGAMESAERRARAAAPAARAGRRERARRLERVSNRLESVRESAADLAARQTVRRERARDDAADRSLDATLVAAGAGGLAVAGALALVALLVAGLRRPLAGLLGATRRLSAGDLEARVEPDGPAELRELSDAFNVMAGDLGAARERIEAGRRRLAATIESLGDALVICDADGTVVEVNPRAGELVPELDPGVPVPAPGGPLPPLHAALAGEVEIAHRDRTLSITAARISGEPEGGVVWTIRDVSERARLERAKSEFVATASHELRSPLTSIKGFVELLAAGSLGDRQREFVDVILLSTNRLVDLVNDLLDVARVEAGQLEVQARPIAVDEAVTEVAALMRPRIEQKGQTLTVEVPSALPAAQADPGRVRQIVTNLLTNAHLYTPDGGHVTVKAGAHGSWLTITVSDDGRGMTREEQERLFDRFYRADQSHTAPGSGLGMSIVRSLVELHGGTIDVESAPGEGTTITVRLPRARGTAELTEPREAVRGKRVLIVEDEPEVARLIAEQLAPFEVEVVVAGSADDARRRLRVDRFDAITLDILLGDASGFELLRQFREDPELCRIPIIVVSVMAADDSLAGEWSVSKPIDAGELTDAIGSAILASRALVLVVGRAKLREPVGEMLRRRGVEHVWTTNASEAARLCEEHRFEVALIDAGMRAPQAALAQLDLRGRRLRRSVVIFSADEERSEFAALDPDPMPVEDAAQAVVDALRTAAAPVASQDANP